MRIRDIRAYDIPPISVFAVSNVSDVLVLAGRNGVGKTRLLQAMVQFFRGQSPFQPSLVNADNVSLVIESTSEDETARWRKRELSTAVVGDRDLLFQTLRQSQPRSHLRSSVIQFESDRTITQVQPFAFSWDFTDPWQEMVGFNQTMSSLKERFTDVVHSLFRKVRSHREAIARRAEELKLSGADSMALDFDDPLIAFKSAFSQLLAPKQLADVDPQNQTLFFRPEPGATPLPITALSSGEREVVNIVFDFLLHNPEDSIIIFDEPELHLHPELSYKLVQTLKTVGARNQFIFCTHSPDIITASLDQTVVFLAPPTPSRSNQAVPVTEQDATNEALRLLGHSVGIVALGKKLVLIEGTASSLDKQVYGSILRERFPDLVLVPAGGKGLISSFAMLKKEVLDRSIWGVEFFMLCDHDVIPITTTAEALESAADGRLRVLPRYHLENYFLDAAILARVFDRLEDAGSPLRDPEAIDRKLRELAGASLSYATALIVTGQIRAEVGNVDIMPKGVHVLDIETLEAALVERASAENQRVNGSLEVGRIGTIARDVHADLARRLKTPGSAWMETIPGKPLLNAFARHANMSSGRLKQAYIVAASEVSPSPFQDVVAIFEAFSAAPPVPSS